MKLYLLTTKQLGKYYIISLTATDAENKLKAMLDKSDYGFSDNRKVINIEILSEEITEFREGIPNFSSNKNLILTTTFPDLK